MVPKPRAWPIAWENGTRRKPTVTQAHEVPQARWDLLDVVETVKRRLEDDEPPSIGRDRMIEDMAGLIVHAQDAVLWYVTPEMTDLVLHAWHTLPPTTLTYELLPDLCGFLVFG